jgi:hypothetical protein
MGTVFAGIGLLEMESHQRLDAFLPRLRTALVRSGMSEEEAAFTCSAFLVGAGQPTIRTIREYRDAWTVCQAMEGILRTLDDGSEAAAARCSVLTHALIDFQDAYEDEHGHPPAMAGAPQTKKGMT